MLCLPAVGQCPVLLGVRTWGELAYWFIGSLCCKRNVSFSLGFLEGFLTALPLGLPQHWVNTHVSYIIGQGSCSLINGWKE